MIPLSLSYLISYETWPFLFTNNPKTQEPSHKTDQGFRDCFGKVPPTLKQNYTRLIYILHNIWDAVGQKSHVLLLNKYGEFSHFPELEEWHRYYDFLSAIALIRKRTVSLECADCQSSLCNALNSIH